MTKNICVEGKDAEFNILMGSLLIDADMMWNIACMTQNRRTIIPFERMRVFFTGFSYQSEDQTLLFLHHWSIAEVFLNLTKEKLIRYLNITKNIRENVESYSIMIGTKQRFVDNWEILVKHLINPEYLKELDEKMKLHPNIHSLNWQWVSAIKTKKTKK
jgi:hypothetical protein